MPRVKKNNSIFNASGLNTAQTAAITHASGPLLIVAGAGTGKTTVLIERVAWLIQQQNVPADNILAVTFTDKAAGELVERLDRRLPMGYVDVGAYTFHGLCQKMLQEHGLEIGLPDQFKVLDATGAWLLVREHLEDFPLRYYKPLGNPTRFIHALLRHFSRCKDEAILPADYLAYAESLKLNADGDPNQPPFAPDGATGGTEGSRLGEIADCYHAYQKLLLDRGCLDFGDLLTEGLRLLRERPAILARYRQQFLHILVDEFQDTNYTQYEIIKLLAAPTNNLTVVGDDDQSIYKFRGASVANIMQFKADFPGCTEVVLNTNYRSRQSILDVAYQSIQHNNPNRLEVQLGDGLSKKLTASTPGNGAVQWLHGATLDDEVGLVVEKIKQLYNASESPSYADFAILVRANDHAQAFVQGLETASIPVEFLASRGLYFRDPVQDVLAYLQLLDDYHQSAALYRVVKWPQWQVSPSDLIVLTHLATKKSRSLYEICRQHQVIENLSDASRKGLDKLLALLEGHTSLARSAPVTEVIHTVLKDTGYLPQLLAKAETRYGQAALRDLQAWFSGVRRFEAESADGREVKHYLARIQLELDAGDTGSVPVDPEAGPDQVRILTVHGAKGLEFHYVFVANLVELRFPSTERKEAIELPDALVKEVLPEGDVHLQEERRLFYVACTRAKEGLFFTSAEEYRDGGRKKRPSIFLRELNLPQPEPQRRLTGLVPTPIRIPIIDDELKLLATLEPKRFSFTQLEAFERCPLFYRYVYLYKVPLPGSAALSFGNTIHTTLQEFCRQYMEQGALRQADLFGNSSASPAPKIPSLDILLKIYAEKWIDDWFPSKENMEKYRVEGREALKIFYDHFCVHQPKIAALEQGFSTNIADFRFYAKIDRIDKSDGGIRLLDYKTGKVPKDATGGHLPPAIRRQLTLYQAVLSQVPQWKQSPVQELSYHYLMSNEQFSFTATPEDITKVVEWAKGVVAKIMDSLKVPVAEIKSCPDPHCPICRQFGEG
jgi:DNA helicase-2/ATP-dependent DNA helicase PcrA